MLPRILAALGVIAGALFAPAGCGPEPATSATDTATTGPRRIENLATLTDPATLEELQIDDHVVAALDLERWRDAFAPDVVAYVVADGERSGVWLARPE